MLKQISFNSSKKSVKLSVEIGALLLALGATGEEIGDLANGEKMQILARLVRAGVTGVLILNADEPKMPHYTIEGANLVIYTKELPQGYNRLTVNVQYGTNEVSSLLVDINVLPGATDGEKEVEIGLDAVKTVGGTGGGGDYTEKRLLYNTAGETTIKDAEGNILTHAQIYNMLMTSPDFVVLVRSDHAFHPNLVTPTQIAFTCSYLGANGQISAERVNITSEDVVTYTSGKGAIMANGNLVVGNANKTFSGLDGGIATGVNCELRARNSFAQGSGAVATGFCSNSHGEGTQSAAQCSHAEGTHTITNGGTSHAEGNYCGTGTNGGSAHAEGSYTYADGAASHTEGYRTTTTEGGSHAQGCWNKVEGGQYAFMHGCGTADDDRKNAFLIAGDGSIYVIGLGGYDGTNSDTALSLQELFGTSNIQASANKAVNGYQVPDLTAEQVTQAYNAVVAGRSVTITDATGNYHLGVTQADVLNGDLAISLIYLNAMLLTYEISGSSVDIQFKNL